MEMKYTPGQWKVKEQGEANHFIVLKNENWLMALQQNGELQVSEQRANAKLIAAAPELLEAAIAVLEALEAVQKSRNYAAPLLRKAIQKAIK